MLVILNCSLKLALSAFCWSFCATIEACPERETLPRSSATLCRAAALARMLPSKGLDHVFATEFKRTRQTVEPAAKIAGQSVKVVSAGDPAGLVRRLMAMESGATALVAGHSNTIGPILVALGLKGKVTITEQQHDDLFVVSLDHAGVPSLQHLQHRVTPPGAGKK